MPTYPTVIYDTAFSDSAGTGGPRVNIDYRMQLIQQRESAAPFLSFMLNLNSEATKTATFKMFETRPNPKKGTISGAVAAGSAANATVTVNVTTGNGSRFNIGDIVKAKNAVAPDATFSVWGRVTAISTDALTVRPNNPLLKIAAMDDADELQIWGNTFAQGTLSAKPSGTKPDLKTFYTQIFKNSYKVTKTHANNRLYGSPERDRLRGEKEIEHLIEVEKQLLYGDGTLDTTNDSDPRTTLTGILNQITTNVLEYGPSLEEAELFDFMTDVHKLKYAPDGKMSRRLVLASSDVLNDIQKIALKNRRVMDLATVYGMDVAKLVYANRTWDLVEDPILSDFLPGWAVVFHPRYVKLREFRPTRLEANIQPNDADYYLDQLLTELGLEVQLEELHGIMKH